MQQTDSDLQTRDWMQLIQECRTSGLSDKEWCFQNGIPVSTFYYHARKLRASACQLPEKKGAAGSPPGGSPLVQEVVPLALYDEGAGIPDAAGPQGRPAVRISCRGFSLEILDSAGEGTILSVLSALQGLC